MRARGYHIYEKGRWHIMKKEDMRKEGLKSPDLWDTVCMAFIEGANYITADVGAVDQHDRARGQAADKLAAELEAALGEF